MRKLVALLIIVIVTDAVMTAGVASSWKFAVLADSRAESWDNNDLGVAANTLGILVKDIKNQSVDLVVFPGDMIGGEPNDPNSLNEQLDSWKLVMKPLYDSGIHVYTVRGNHEYNPYKMGSRNTIDPSYEPFLNRFPLTSGTTSPDGGFTYSFIHKNAKFIGFDQYINRSESFDSSLYALHSNQGQMMNNWVTAQINSSTSLLNFAFAHEMLFPSESHPDCMANDPDSRDVLVAALGTHHGTYICGHDHMYLRGTASDGNGHTVPELVVGTAGGGNYRYASMSASGYTGPDTFAMVKNYGSSSNPYFGYLLVTVNDNNTWTGEFKAFQYDTYEKGKPHNAGAIQTIDRFRTSQDANGSQIVAGSDEAATTKPQKVQPGFEGIIAVAGFLTIAYLALDRR
jgi:hypothetical protein